MAIPDRLNPGLKLSRESSFKGLEKTGPCEPSSPHISRVINQRENIPNSPSATRTALKIYIFVGFLGLAALDTRLTTPAPAEMEIRSETHPGLRRTGLVVTGCGLKARVPGAP